MDPLGGVWAVVYFLSLFLCLTLHIYLLTCLLSVSPRRVEIGSVLLSAASSVPRTLPDTRVINKHFLFFK